jgi:hypothetical protein
MASGYNAGRFNLALASGTAGAAAFALFAMPEARLEACLEGIGLASIFSSPSEAATRVTVTMAMAALIFLLVWVSLRSCDPPVRRSGGEASEDDNWPLSLVVSGSGGDMMFGDADSDDPFSALARGAERLDGPLDVAHMQSEEYLSPIDESGDAVLDPAQLLAHLPCPMPAPAGVGDDVQQLNAGLAQSEWPIASDGSEEEADAMNDRLRNVLQDLKLSARRG